ncbi:MAG: 4-hydroxy-tetrahydrodipicolinate synthase [Steroidobacter sp.]
MHQFSGIWVPLITPFTPDGKIDFNTLRNLIAQLRDSGVAGFVAFGTTGEPAALSNDEKQRVIACVVQESGALPVIAGASGITPDNVCDQLALYDSLPLAGVMITAPHYVRPSQQAIIEFFNDIAARTSLPIVVYDIPYRTGVQMELETLRAIARIPSVVAIKDCGGDARKTQSLIADQRLAVLSGEDHLLFTTIAQGGAGGIAASAHLHPRLFVRMHRALNEGNPNEARALHHALAPMINALFSEPSPAPVKAVLAALGTGHCTVRKPLLVATESAAQRAFDAYQRVTEIARVHANCQEAAFLTLIDE